MERLRRIVTVSVSTMVLFGALTAQQRTARFEYDPPMRPPNTHPGAHVVIREKSVPAAPAADRYDWAAVALVAGAAAMAGAARRRRGTEWAGSHRTFRLS